MSIESKLQDIVKLTSALAEAEEDYAEKKAVVSELWKEYWPASEAKKAANARRKELQAKVQAALEDAPELKALVKSIA